VPQCGDTARSRALHWAPIAALTRNGSRRTRPDSGDPCCDARANARLSVAPGSLKRVKDTIRRITKRNRAIRLDSVLQELGVFTHGWVGYFWHARTPSVFQNLDKRIRRRLRCYQWKLWKTPRNRAQQLRRAGVDATLAWGTAFAGPRYWRTAGSPALTWALSNERLHQRGFHSLHGRYQALATR